MPVTYYNASTYNTWVTNVCTSTTATTWTTSGTNTITATFWVPYEQTEVDQVECQRIRAVVMEQSRKVAVEERRASRKALCLLLRHLTEQQRADYRNTGWFYVLGGDTGNLYRIRRGVVANIDVMQQGRVVDRLCAHPANDARCPVHDVMLAQALHLAYNETEFVATANHHRILGATADPATNWEIAA